MDYEVGCVFIMLVCEVVRGSSLMSCSLRHQLGQDLRLLSLKPTSDILFSDE